MILLWAAMAATQVLSATPGFPENVEISQRFDCEVRSVARQGDNGPEPYSEPYAVGDYVFLFPASVDLIIGHSIPYVHTRADGRTLFQSATIEASDPNLGPSFGFALRTGPNVKLSFTSRDPETDDRVRHLKGSFRSSSGRVVELEGKCDIRQRPVQVSY
ncbi:hypothetical protein [Brevundimonas nasdae]|uniref:hypothetical protein n=1 Tax=Brevundimonas nasdae TaxID=172043 RepID=UPI003F694A3F